MVMVVGKDESVYKQSTCGNCASILRYVPSEVQDRRVSCMGDVDTFYYVVCPCCGDAVAAKRY